MKKYFILPFIGLLICCETISQSKKNSSNDTEAIIDEFSKAIGGRENWLGIETVRLTGSTTMGGIRYKLTQIYKEPNKTLTEIQVDANEKWIRACDGTIDWTIEPFTNGKKIKSSEEETEEAKNTTSVLDNILMNHGILGYPVELLGEEEINNRDTYVLKLTETDKDRSRNYYVDKETYLILKMTMNDSGTQYYYSDYRKIGNLVDAFKVTAVIGADENKIEYDKIEYGVDIEDGIFEF